MPRVGDKEFAYTPEGEAEAQAYAEATGMPVQSEDEMMYAVGGKVDGSKRSVKEYLGGGMVKKPMMPMYKHGGKVKKGK